MTRSVAEIEAELDRLERDWRACDDNDATEGVPGPAGQRLGVGRREALLRDGGHSGGNPYHDVEGKFTSGPAGGRAARRARRKRRIRRKARALKARHKAERIAVAAKQRERHARHKEYYGRKTANLARRQAREIHHMETRHARETERHDRQVEHSHAENDRQLAAGHVSEEHHARRREALEQSKAWIRDANRRELETRQDWHQGERNTLRDERREAIATLQERDAKERRITLARQRAEKAEFREEHGLEPRGGEHAGRSSIDGVIRTVLSRGEGGLDESNPGVARRFGAARTHKASNAESILKACLRKLKLTARYKRGLTGKQALRLLGAIRDYARAWLHHECEQLIREYGRAVDELQGNRGGVRTLGGTGVGGSEHPGVAGTGRDGEEVHEEDHRVQSGVGEGVRLPGGVRGDLGTTRGLSSAMRRHVGRFFDRARTFVREAILAGTMALSGPEGVTDDDLAEVDRAAQVQVAYLDNFAREVEARGPAELAGPAPLPFPPSDAMTAAEMAARAEMYGSSAWQAAQQVNRRGVVNDGRAVRERRFHSKRSPELHACRTCLDQSNLGWQPVGTLLPIGDAECLTNCDCYFVYELADGSNFITRRGWQRVA